jgi:hypothetical protein
MTLHLQNRTLVLCLLVISSFACSEDHRFEQADANARVTLTPAQYPLPVGRNELTLEVTGPRGERLHDEATVVVRYGLPPMPGMAPVSHELAPVRVGERYAFAVDVHTRARWTIDVLVRRRGAPESRFLFGLDAP